MMSLVRSILSGRTVPRAAMMVVSAAVLIALPAHAEDALPDAEQSAAFSESSDAVKICTIGVRLLRGQAPEPAAQDARLHADELLTDVQKQLKSLPFTGYEILDRKERTVKLNEKGVFELSDGQDHQHTLTVEPHLMSDNRIHITVNWRGPSGEELLSTKLRVSNGKNVVLGTGNPAESSTILCVSLNCL